MSERKSAVVEIVEMLGGWVRGQLIIGSILAGIYTIGFAVIGVSGWWLIGPLAGVLNFVPYLGAVLTVAMIALTVLFTDGSAEQWMWAMLVFAVAQGLEGFVLTPKILGRHLRMPGWAVFLTILIGGMIFGPLGVIVATPVLAIGLLLWRRSRPEPLAHP